MRLAFSAAAATSGLILLGLALYGQPAQYVQEAQHFVNDWLAAKPPAASTADNVMTAQMNQLQQEVALLQARLAETKASSADQPPAAAPTPAAPDATLSGPPARGPADTRLPPVAAGGDMPSATMPVQGLPSNVQPQPAEPVLTVKPPSGMSASKPSEAAPANVAPSPGPAAASVLPPLPAPVTVTPPVPPPFPPASAASPAGADAATPTLRIIPPEPPPEPPARAGRTRTAESPPPERRASRRPPDASDQMASRAARPTPGLSPDVDESESVLARLRQATQPPSPRSPDTAPAAAPSPAIPRLTAARAALRAARMEDAVRLLQEAQLQLVFRPVGMPGGDGGASARGAADVAHALEALSANNPSASAHFVDRALADLNGAAAAIPFDAPGSVAAGYAPAYPPR